MTAKQANITTVLLDYCLFGCKYNWENVSGNGIKCADFEGFTLKRVCHFLLYPAAANGLILGINSYKYLKIN